ncbi:atypical chemokine receptor 2 [Trichomycterus rosablanca]|uniref:atypical chemokine receptor 2 n=1 Tax=Trichomycterus rosablanca TaxID=2290929 RepID=UPI002F34EFCA
MDAHQPAPLNDSDYDYDYREYYSSDALTDFGPCEKHHVKKFGRSALPVFYSLACALGLMTNALLALVFVRCRRARRPMPACSVCADLLLSGTLPFWAVYAARDWIFGWHACKTVTVAYVVALYAGNLSLACTVLRIYLDGACALGCLGRLGGRRCDATWCACVWLLAALAAAPHLNHVEARHFHGEDVCTYHYEHAYGWRIYVRCQLILLGFVVPFVVALVAALLVWRGSAGGARRLASGLAGVLLLLWFPYTVVNVLHLLQELHLISECGASIHLDFAVQTTESLAFTRVFVNPLAYAVLDRRTRRALTDWCGVPREYLLRDSDAAHSDSGDEAAVELRALQNFSNPEYERGCAEREGHFLPHAT